MQTTELKICDGNSCRSRGSEYIFQRVENDKEMYNYPKESVNISKCMCQGKCKESPVIVLDGQHFTRQNPATVSKLLRQKVEKIKNTRKESHL